MTTTAKADVLAAVRESLAAAKEELSRHGRPEPAREEAPAPRAPASLEDALEDATERIARFREELELIGASSTLVYGEHEALTALVGIVRRIGAKRVAVSDDPLAVDLARRIEGIEVAGPDGDRELLFEAELGLTSARWGIADTATLVLESAAEKNRLVSLVPPVHVALLDTARLLPNLGELLAVLEGDDPRSMSRAITFITGPSRTADIELTMVVGVHGPRELHVILLRREDA